jgi:hypothetical protein
LKKTCSFVLIFCLLISLIPISVFSQEAEVQMLEQPEMTELEQFVAQNESMPDLSVKEHKTGSKKIVREVKEKRTKNSKDYLLEDGSYQSVISLGDVHYEDENGQLTDIQTNIIDEADLEEINVPLSKDSAVEVRGLIKEFKEKKIKKNKSDSDFRALQVPFDVKLPKRFTKGYTIGKGEDKLTFIPVGANRSLSVMDSVYRDQLNYMEAWTSTNVTLKVTSDGIKEVITLRDNQAPNLFSFEVKGNLTEELNNESLKLLPAWLIDANGTYRDVSQTLRRDNDKVFVDLVADVQGLSYPVVIDPTIVTADSESMKVTNLIRQAIVNEPTISSDGYISYVATNAVKHKTFYVNNIMNFINVPIFTFNTSSIPTNASIHSVKFKFRGGTFGYMDQRNVLLEWYPYKASYTLNDWANPIGNSAGMYTTSSLQGDMNREISLTNIQQINKASYTSLRIGLDGGMPPIENSIQFSVYTGNPTENPGLIINYNLPSSAATIITPNGEERLFNLHNIEWNPAKDIEDATSKDYGLYAPVRSRINLNSSSTRIFQLFEPTLDAKFVDNVMFTFDTGDFYNAPLKISLYDTDGTKVTSEILGSAVNIIAPNNYHPIYGGTINVKLPRIDLMQGHTYAIGIEILNLSSNIHIRLNSLAGSSHRCGLFWSTQWIRCSYDINMRIDFKKEAPLQYQIQLSPNNGASWSDLVVLTTANATSYPFDFSTIAPTTQAKIRVRAYDGSLYGPWDESNSTFKIGNRIPSLSITSYTNGEQLNVSSPTLTWSYFDLDGDSQSTYQVKGSRDNWATTTYNSGELSSAASNHTTPALEEGTWSFAVRVKDGYGWSDWQYRNQLFLSASYEPNDTAGTAHLITPNTLYKSYLTLNDIDYFKYTATSEGQHNITLKVPSTKNYDIQIYNSSQVLIMQGTQSTGIVEEVSFYGKTGQTYYIKIAGVNGDFSAIPYEFKLTEVIFNYQYDLNGRISTMTYHKGLYRYEINYVFDDNGNFKRSIITKTETN